MNAIFTTARLTVRRFQPSDSADLAEILTDPDVTYFEPYETFTAAQCVQEAVNFSQSSEFFAVCLHGKVIGKIYFSAREYGTYEIGWTFGLAYQGCGYAAESIRGMVKYAFTELGVRRIIAQIDTRNAPSKRLAERVGMRQEAEYKQLFPRKDNSAVYSDFYVYALLKADWLSQSAVCRLIGLTGQTGAGKSEVSRYFAEQGFGVIDADAAARAVVQKGLPCLEAIAAQFGSGMLLPDGTLNRRAVAELIFHDADAKARYEALIFPFIMDYIQNAADRLAEEGYSMILLDAPTLFESGIDKRCVKIIAVTAPHDLRKARITARDGITPEQAEARMRSQHTEEFFRQHADYVICNDGTTEQLAARCQEIIHLLNAIQ